jgi:hypothetical protein
MNFLKSSALLIGVFLCLYGNAQTEDDNETKKLRHFVAIQANPLLRQVLSFSNPGAVNNPFLLKYSLRPVDSKLEYNAGFGYSFSSSETRDGFNNNLSDLTTRVGVALKKTAGKKFDYGFGIDGVINFSSAKTVNVVVTNFGGGQVPVIDSTISVSSTTGNRFGGGLQLNFAYHISPKIHIGSEATYYFLAGKDKESILVDRYSNNFGSTSLIKTTSKTNSNNQSSNLNLSLPVAIFLILKL